MNYIGILIFLLIYRENQLISGKSYTRCSLTEQLLKEGFPRSFLGHWVCLIENQSGSSTTRVTVKADGSKDLGLFQINSKEWCRFGVNGGNCDMFCENLINDNITDDALCAKRVFNIHGFNGWTKWKKNCSGRSLSNYAMCLQHPIHMKN